ncbi:MAG: response regulator transcription factor [Pseudomonadota bacterium]
MSEINHVLIIDNDIEMAEFLKILLKRRGYTVTVFTEDDQIMLFLKSTLVSLVIIDLLMPNLNVSRLCQQIKEKFYLPILILTYSNRDEDKIIALETHADDYITKPFNFNILLARINALLRRRRLRVMEVYHFSDWRFDVKEHQLISPKEESMILNAQLEKLLLLFLSRPGYLYTREHLLEKLRGMSTSFELRRIDNLINQLRHIFYAHDPKHKIIETVRTQGYRLNSFVDVKRH